MDVDAIQQGAGGVESWLKLVGGEYNNILFYLPFIFIKLKSKEPGEKTGQAPLLYFSLPFFRRIRRLDFTRSRQSGSQKWMSIYGKLNEGGGL